MISKADQLPSEVSGRSQNCFDNHQFDKNKFPEIIVYHLEQDEDFRCLLKIDENYYWKQKQIFCLYI